MRFHCKICGRLSQSTLGRASQLCGPHALVIDGVWSPKPLNWWHGFEGEMRKMRGK